MGDTRGKGMHPRNPYEINPPNFKMLAMEYPEFRKYCTLNNNGTVSVNFQEDAAVRCLTKILLIRDFQLDVELPIGHLVPRLPQRLNYCLLIQDLLKSNKIEEDAIGIDIGTGPSCIYALLGAKEFGWKFIASDGDEKSVEYAHNNVARNQLAAQICVAHVDPNAKSVLMSIINEIGENKQFAFCMCNPPFFETSETEEKFCAEPSLGCGKYSNRIISHRNAPHSVTFASSAELQVEGGEVKFVNRMIDDSIILRDRIKIYTSMLGRKSSIKPLQRRLKRLGNDVKIMITTLNQGRTTRWCIIWTFCKDIVLAELENPIMLKIPKPGMKLVEEQIKSLQGIYRRESENTATFEFKNITWTHLRARRRAEERLERMDVKRKRYNTAETGTQVTLGSGDGKDSYTNSGNFDSCKTERSSKTQSTVAIQAYFPIPEHSIVPPILECRVTLEQSKMCDPYWDVLRFEKNGGQKIHLQQFIQYLQNTLVKNKK